MISTKKHMQSGYKTKICDIIRVFSSQTLGILHGNTTGESSEMGGEYVSLSEQQGYLGEGIPELNLEGWVGQLLLQD